LRRLPKKLEKRKMSKKISIIIRTKNEERWILSCLNKIYAQTIKNIEVIIVDNNSKDKTLQKIKEFPVKILKIKKFIPGKAINLGIKKSTGDIIVCLSAHCLPVNTKWLENLIKPLKNKKVAGVYGRQQPMPYSSYFDKRDLITIFGLDKKIQTKDPFFHNANSAFKKTLWKKIPFDDHATNIEDRIWGKKVISKGYKIVYEPKASVFHWHGVHQDLDPKRASNVVGIIESLDKNLYKINPQKIENLNIVAIIPVKGKNIIYNKKNIIDFSINNLKDSKFIKKIFLSTDNKLTAKLAKKYDINLVQRSPKLSNKSSDLLSVCRHTLSEIEKTSNFPDLIVILTEQYPFREKDLFDNMIKKLVYEGLDVAMASKNISGGVWLNKRSGTHQIIIDGLVPNKLRKENAFRSSIGLGCVVRPKNLRNENLYNGKIGFYEIKDPLSLVSIRENSIKNLSNKISTLIK